MSSTLPVRPFFGTVGRAIALAAWLVGSAGFVSAASDPAKPAVIEPVSASVSPSGGSFVPGQGLVVAARFDIQPGWHLYWKNPGDTGLPTKLTLSAPEGAAVEGPEWPLPIRFELPGEVVGFGYEGSALMTWKLSPPAGAAPGSKLPLKVGLKWLACSAKLCVPGRSEHELVLEAAGPQGTPAPAAPPGLADFAYPERSSNGSPVGLALTGSLAQSGSSTVQLLLEWRADAQASELFCVPPAGYVLVGTPKASGLPAKIALELRAENPSPGAARELECLVTFAGKDGKRRGVTERFVL